MKIYPQHEDLSEECPPNCERHTNELVPVGSDFWLWFHKMSCFGFFVILFVFASPSPVYAGKLLNPDKAREAKLLKDKVSGMYSDLNLAISYQGLGLVLRGELGYKFRLYGHKSALFENNFLLLKGIVQISPAYSNTGVGITFQPLSIFNIRARYLYRYHFPTFSSGTTFKDQAAIDSRFKDTSGFSQGQDRLSEQLDAVLKTNGGKRPLVTGHLLSVGTTLKIKVKSFIAAVSGELTWAFFSFDDVDKSEFLYEPFADLIGKKNDLLFDFSAIVGYELKSLLFLVIYSHSLFVEAGTNRALVGPGVRYQFAKKSGVLYEPYILGLVRWYTNHRFRVGVLPNFAVVVGTSFK